MNRGAARNQRARVARCVTRNKSHACGARCVTCDQRARGARDCVRSTHHPRAVARGTWYVHTQCAYNVMREAYYVLLDRVGGRGVKLFTSTVVGPLYIFAGLKTLCIQLYRANRLPLVICNTTIAENFKNFKNYFKNHFKNHLKSVTKYKGSPHGK